MKTRTYQTVQMSESAPGGKHCIHLGEVQEGGGTGDNICGNSRHAHHPKGGHKYGFSVGGGWSDSQAWPCKGCEIKLAQQPGVVFGMFCDLFESEPLEEPEWPEEDKLREEVDKLNRENVLLRDEKEYVERDYQRVLARAQMAEKKLGETTVRAHENDLEQRTLSNQVKGLQNQLAQKDLEILDLTGQRTRANKRADENYNKLINKHRDYDTLAGYNSSLHQEVARLRKQLIDAQESSPRVEGLKAERLVKQNKDLQESLRRESQNILDLQEKLDREKARANYAQQQVDSVRAQRDDVRREKEEAVQEMLKANRDLGILTESLKIVRREVITEVEETLADIHPSEFKASTVRAVLYGLKAKEE